MDIYGKDKGNISLLPSLQPPNFDEAKLKNIIINTQICFYEMKIVETNKRIQRLEERNQELEDNLNDTNNSMKTLQEEKKQEISGLNLQIISHAAKIDEYKKQLTTMEKSRIEDKSTHIAKTLNINEKYKNTRIKLISQIKLLSAKTNILDDYKLMKHILEKKLNEQNQSLSCEKDKVAENLRQIERKFKIDREKLKKGLYDCLLEFATVFQLKIARHMSRPNSKLLSENIALNNKLATIAETRIVKERHCTQYNNVKEELKRKIYDMNLDANRFIIVAKLEKCVIAMLRDIHNKAHITFSKLDKRNYLTEGQYVMNRDNAKNKTLKCEFRVKHLEVSLYREKQKFAIVKFWKEWVSDQLQLHLQMLYDVKIMLMNIKTECTINKCL